MTVNWITEIEDETYRHRIQVRLAENSEPGEGGCILWTGALDKDGYGVFRIKVDGRSSGTGAHRASWLACFGPIPAGFVLDHECRVRACVNPCHLEPVTTRVNVNRGERRGPAKKKRGCKVHGHSDGKEIAQRNGYSYWYCYPCRREYYRRYRLKSKYA